MKLRKLVIENFRRFSKRIEFDFTDSFGRAKPLVVFVGPNGAGKTTILDAIALSLQPSLSIRCVRPDFPITPRAIVSKGARRAVITCELEYTENELAVTRELLDKAEKTWPQPTSREVTVTWEYPGKDSSDLGFSQYAPRSGRSLLAGRKLIAELSRTSVISPDWNSKVGSVFTFDQQRSSIEKTIPPHILKAIRPNNEGSTAESPEKTSDARLILISLAVQAQAKSLNGTKETKYDMVKKVFANVCAPKKIVGLVRDDHDDVDMQFSDGDSEFNFFGLSSGEQMVLSFVLSFVDRRIQQSLVLIDELELHLHPIWQRQLLHDLAHLGEDNQLFITTHSPYLRDIVPSDCVYSLGELGDLDRVAQARSLTHG